MNTIRALIRHYLMMILLLLTLAAATVYYFYWHWKPFTQNAFVFANTRAVSPMMEGYIREIHIRNNQFVQKGQPLFTTFRPPYQLRVAELRNDISAKEAELRSAEARILLSEADIERYTAELANNRYLSERAKLMYQSASVSQAYAEERFRAEQVSAAQKKAAVHSREIAIHDCALIRAQIDKLKNSLELAVIYDGMTVVTALNDGYVTNMSMVPGGYYRPGDVLFGFIDSREWWVQANFKESELSGIREGQDASIWLWQYPGRVFRGKVDSVGWGAERRSASPETGLPTVTKENEWFLLPQRFPVQIRILDPPSDLMLHHGGSAYVQVDVPSRPVRQFFWELFLWIPK